MSFCHAIALEHTRPGVGNRKHVLIFLSPYSTLVYVEGEASMGSWEDAEGKRQTALNITQRKLVELAPPKVQDVLC